MNIKQLWRATQEAFHRQESTSFRLVEGSVWGLILLSIGLFALELALGEDHPWTPRVRVVEAVLSPA